MATRRGKCQGCGEIVPAAVTPVFEGFKKVGEKLHCPFCGEKVTPVSRRKKGNRLEKSPDLKNLFGEISSKKPVNPFGDQQIRPEAPRNPFGDEAPAASAPLSLFQEPLGAIRNCRNCKSYLVHPFTQKCVLHDREVVATDVCDEFQRR